MFKIAALFLALSVVPAVQAETLVFSQKDYQPRAVRPHYKIDAEAQRLKDAWYEKRTLELKELQTKAELQNMETALQAQEQRDAVYRYREDFERKHREDYQRMLDRINRPLRRRGDVRILSLKCGDSY